MTSGKRRSTHYIRYADNECKLQEGFRDAEKSIRESTKIILAHKNELLKLKRIASDRDVKAIRLFHDGIENHFRSWTD